MNRPVTLFTGQWADLSLDTVAKKQNRLVMTDSSWHAGVITLKLTRQTSNIVMKD